jgi:hypothetical protein
MFGIKDGMCVSDSINSVSKALHEHFVPNFLGFNHLSRDEAISKHGRTMFKELFETPDDTMFTIFDGTYLYIDKSTDFEQQKRTYCVPKKRNLIKPMMVCLEDGYCVAAPGPYICDAKNNDANILKSMLIEGMYVLFLCMYTFHLWY